MYRVDIMLRVRNEIGVGVVWKHTVYAALSSAGFVLHSEGTLRSSFRETPVMYCVDFVLRRRSKIGVTMYAALSLADFMFDSVRKRGTGITPGSEGKHL